MIPKLAHFHWAGPRMSWLRMVTISSFKYHNPDWEIRLHGTPEDIGNLGLTHGQAGDWTRWRILSEHGGFSVGSDIIFIKPVPADWLDCDVNFCSNGTSGVHQMAMVGARPKHRLFFFSEPICEGVLKLGNLNYQSFGAPFLGEIIRASKGLMGKEYDQPMDALCHYDHTRIDELWESASLDLPCAAIGVHWYGAHAKSAAKELSMRSWDDSWISRLIK